MVAETALEPGWLKLEITENCLLEDLAAADAVLAAIHELGIHCAIADFGVGFASLSYVRRLSVDSLKIDRELVSAIDSDARDQGVVQAIVGMVHALGITVVAAGVQRATQHDALRNARCDLIQGHLLASAASIEQLFELSAEGETENRMFYVYSGERSTQAADPSSWGEVFFDL